jgi:hypothetical protein
LKRIHLVLLAAGALALGVAACGESPTDVARNDGAELANTPGENVILRGDVGDFVWCDLNDNGAQDDGPDSGVNGVDVTIQCIRLVDGSLFEMTFTTTNSPVTGLPGWYNFNAVPAGSCVAYVEPATIPAGKVLSDNPCGGPLEFFIGEGTSGNNNKNVDFCLVEDMPDPGAIGDFVWCDLNDDGVQDPGEPGVAGVVVDLSCADGSSNSTVTDANGFYLFQNITPGVLCTVSIDLSTTGGKLPGSNCPTSLDVTVGPGETNLDQDFCLVEPPVEEDCCEDGKRPDALSFTYVAEDCSHSNNSQDPAKTDCDDFGTLTTDVYIKVTDKDQLGHRREKVFFEGPVSAGGSFTMSAANAGASKIPGDTRIWVLDASGTTVLQKVKLHTSCSQPLISGEQFGSLVLESCGE